MNRPLRDRWCFSAIAAMSTFWPLAHDSAGFQSCDRTARLPVKQHGVSDGAFGLVSSVRVRTTARNRSGIRWDIRSIRHPELIGRGHAKAAVNEIRSGPSIVISNPLFIALPPAGADESAFARIRIAEQNVGLCARRRRTIAPV